jgi:hypothetical protein
MWPSKYQKFSHIECNKTTNNFATVNGSNSDKAPFSLWIIVQLATCLDHQVLSLYLRIVHCFDMRRQHSFEGDIHGRHIPGC